MDQLPVLVKDRFDEQAPKLFRTVNRLELLQPEEAELHRSGEEIVQTVMNQVSYYVSVNSNIILLFITTAELPCSILNIAIPVSIAFLLSVAVPVAYGFYRLSFSDDRLMRCALERRSIRDDALKLVLYYDNLFGYCKALNNGQVQVIAEMEREKMEPALKLMRDLMNGCIVSEIHHRAHKAMVAFTGICALAYASIFPYMAHKLFCGGGVGLIPLMKKFIGHAAA